MALITLSILIISSYLLGSIPTAVWLGKAFFRIDVREHGSKNAGATNTIRVLGIKVGLPVFAIDVLKGFAAVSLIHFVSGIQAASENFLPIQFLLGFAAVLGHIFPIFASFRGGKGVATLAGVVLAIMPLATALAFGVFLIIVLTTRYISLGSITAGICFPFIVRFVLGNTSILLLVFSIAIAILLLITHRKNIGRLMRGEESKFRLNTKNTVEAKP